MRRVYACVLSLTAWLAFATAVRADVFKDGEDSIPGHPGETVKWRAGYRKSPGSGKSVHFWYRLMLKDPDPTDDVTFVVCAMINVNQTKKDMPKTKADLDRAAGTWRCRPDGTAHFYPNYHFGCKRIRLHAGNNWTDVTSFDETVELKADFQEQDLVAPYLDFARDCPSGFVNCAGVFDAQNQFLEPGDGNFPGDPDGTSSWWVVTGGVRPSGPIRGGSDGWLTGNWYTMAFPLNRYDCVLVGDVTNTPGGGSALVRFTFPASTRPAGQNVVILPIPGAGCTGNSVSVKIPFTITSSLMGEVDEHTHIDVEWTPSECADYPSGQLIEFLGEVQATGFTFFPDGTLLFSPGDFMHGVHAQFAGDYDPPDIKSHSLVPIDAQRYEILVTASDPTSMVVGATLRYTVDGASQPDLPIPYDDPAADEDVTFFKGVLGPFPPGAGIEYSILLVDDVGNAATFFGEIGEKYCAVNPNSTGFEAHITAIGSPSIADDDLTLRAEPVPDQFFLFFHGAVRLELPFGNGFLCAGGDIRRLNPPAAAVGNRATRVVELAAKGFVPGTRHFQCWFRDPAAGGAAFNTSNGRSVTFLP